MWYVGIDLHRKTVVIGGVHETGRAQEPVTLQCRDTESILKTMDRFMPFRAVVEASSSYRWLYDLLSPMGSVVLAHPLRLRAIVQRRSKTDKLDAMLLANLLRINQIPLAYVPPKRYQTLRDLTRYRAGIVREATSVKIKLRDLCCRYNIHIPYRMPFGPRGQQWFAKQDFNLIDSTRRDYLLAELVNKKKKCKELDVLLNHVAKDIPEVEALLSIHGIGLFSALLIIGELGDPGRFEHAAQVGAYAGLTPTVNQSGNHCYHGHISRQGSSWLRWILVEAAQKVTRKDRALNALYTRIRKRSGRNIARVAVARKLAEICWKRLKRWHIVHQTIALAS